MCVMRLQQQQQLQPPRTTNKHLINCSSCPRPLLPPCSWRNTFLALNAEFIAFHYNRLHSSSSTWVTIIHPVPFTQWFHSVPAPTAPGAGATCKTLLFTTINLRNHSHLRDLFSFSSTTLTNPLHGSTATIYLPQVCPLISTSRTRELLHDSKNDGREASQEDALCLAN